MEGLPGMDRPGSTHEQAPDGMVDNCGCAGIDLISDRDEDVDEWEMVFFLHQVNGIKGPEKGYNRVLVYRCEGEQGARDAP